jgi:TPR repeat protein
LVEKQLTGEEVSISHHSIINFHQGDRSAQFEFTRAISHNSCEMTRDWKCSADQGNSVGQYDYGFFVGKAQGVAQNVFQAGHYYKLAVHQ